MRCPCVFVPLKISHRTVELGVLDSNNQMCVAEVKEVEGTFMELKGKGGPIGNCHMVEPGVAFTEEVRFHNWGAPGVLYFRSREEQQSRIDNRIAALTALARAKYS